MGEGPLHSAVFTGCNPPATSMLLGLKPKPAKLFQFGSQAMAKRILGPQLAKEGFRLFEGLCGDLLATEQLSPTTRDLLVGKQTKFLALGAPYRCHSLLRQAQPARSPGIQSPYFQFVSISTRLGN